MPLGSTGDPSLRMAIVAIAIVSSSPCRPTLPRPQNLSTAPTHTIANRTMRCVASDTWMGCVGFTSPARSCAISMSMRTGMRPDGYVEHGSICLVSTKQTRNRHQQNFQIQHQGPVAHVLEIVVNSALHIL